MNVRDDVFHRDFRLQQVGSWDAAARNTGRVALPKRRKRRTGDPPLSGQNSEKSMKHIPKRVRTQTHSFGGALWLACRSMTTAHSPLRQAGKNGSLPPPSASSCIGGAPGSPFRPLLKERMNKDSQMGAVFERNGSLYLVNLIPIRFVRCEIVRFSKHGSFILNNL